MSEELETKRKDVTIYSIAYDGKYHLSAMRRGVDLKDSERTYSMDEYVDVMKKMWEAYLDRNAAPSLCGIPITDLALVQETVHCIAPNTFYASDGWKLPENREQFLHWLMAEKYKISARIPKKAVECLVGSLEGILKTNMQRKG